MSSPETIAFQAETKKLLDLVIHSLYTHKEIFLRELVSNASDALDKLRYEALTDESLDADPDALRIRLEVDPEKRTLEIVDNGIGMTREEVIENVGTIARSGTKGFLEALEGAAPKGGEAGAPDMREMIGQFGVGFYSAFMVADEVELETRRAGQEGATRWRSRGAGDYTLEEIEREACGTSVRLHLKPIDTDDEEARDFTSEAVLRGVIKRYSDFIEYPIEMEVGEGDEREVKVLNSRKPLWTRPKGEVEEAEYTEFYRHLTHDWHEPLETIHFRAEGTTEYTALLYVPKERPVDLFDPNQQKSRVQLYVKRVFITAECEELLPVWLRFVSGVVDSADLPLNVSRETLQHNRQMGQIKKRLTRKTLDALGDLLKNRREDYGGFWEAFGPVLKEGIYYDDEFRQELAGLVLARSTNGDETCTLAEYVERMPVKQEDIYVLVAPDLESARRSPHLEALRAKGYEVLFLTDPVDDFVLERLSEFQDHKLRRIDRGDLDLDEEGEKEEREAREKELEPVLEALRKELSENVSDVRFSHRLTDSPACLVAGEFDPSPELRRMMRASGQDVPDPKRVLELNPNHPLVAKLDTLRADEDQFGRFGSFAELLFELARVAEGNAPSDPEKFGQAVSELMLKS